MKVYIGADHRGFVLKEALRPWLEEQGVELFDVGAATYTEGDDYVDYAKAVAEAVAGDKNAVGIVLCGSGVGVDVVANKIDGIRSGFAHSEDQVRSARHDDAINVLALPADSLTIDQAKALVKVFLDTPFTHVHRYERRLDKIKQIEETN